MKLSQFKFKLPEEKIALYPAKYRDESRLMVIHKSTGEIEHVNFKDILNYFDDKDVFIFNDTKVFPARLYGNKEKTGARIEVFLLRELNEELRLWDVLVDPARKIRIGNKLYFGDDDSMVAEVIDNTTSRGRTLRFLYDGPHDEFKKALYALGEPPLPPFIHRPAEPEDEERFQTIYAKNEGAVTVPAAGLHFSRELMKRMEIKGIDFSFITMHAGLGNFRDIDVEDLTKHKMDSEQMFVNAEACRIVNEAKDRGNKVCAIGTTVMRAIETKEEGMDLGKITPSKYDSVLGEGTGAGMIFGNTGGVMEAALRTVYRVLEGKEAPADFYQLRPVRGLNNRKEAEVTIAGKNLKVCILYGTAAAEEFLAEDMSGYHFVEVMTCPGGCISGAGQPDCGSVPVSDAVRKKRIASLYQADERAQYRNSMDNPEIGMIYNEFFKEPLSLLSETLLHTTYKSE